MQSNQTNFSQVKVSSKIQEKTIHNSLYGIIFIPFALLMLNIGNLFTLNVIDYVLLAFLCAGIILYEAQSGKENNKHRFSIPELLLCITWLLFGTVPTIAIFLASYFILLTYTAVTSRETISKLIGTTLSIATTFTILWIVALLIKITPPLTNLSDNTSWQIVGLMALTFVLNHFILSLVFQTKKADLSSIFKLLPSSSDFFFISLILPLFFFGQQANPIFFGGFMLIITLTYTRMANTVGQTDATDKNSLTKINIQLNPSLDEILILTANKIQETIPHRALFISLIEDHNQPDFISYPVIIEDEKDYPKTIKEFVTGSLEKQVFDSQTLVHISPPESDRLSDLSLQALKENHYTSFLGIPLKPTSNETIGIIGLLDNQRLNGFSAEEQQIAQDIGNQVSLYIQNKQLQQRNRQLLNYLDTINESIRTLLFKLDSQEAIESICQIAQSVTKADRVAVYLLDREQNRMALSHGINLTESYQTHSKNFYFPSNTKPKIIRDINPQTASEQINLIASDGQFKAMAETFLITRNIITGMLVIYHEQPYDFTTSELNLLQVLANQITVALENTDLLRSLELYASEMAQLVYLSRTSLSSLQPEEVANNAVEILRQMLTSDSAIIGIIQPVYEGNEVLAVLGSNPPGLHTPDRTSLTLYPEFNTLKDKMASVRNVIYLDFPNISRGLRQLMIKNGEQTIAMIPLSVNNNVFGMMILGYKNRRQFSNRDWQFIETAANLTAAQIQNAQMYNATRKALVKRLEELSFIETLIQQISSSLDFESVINSILQATIQVTNADTVFLAQKTPNGKYRIIYEDYKGPTPKRKDIVQSKLEGVMHEVIESGNVVLSPAYGLPEDATITPLFGRYPSVLAVPLQQQNQIIGVLGVENHHRNLFTEEQAKFLQNLAGHTVISLSNARYVEERQHQLETLTKLRQLSLSVVGKTDEYAVAVDILHTAINILNAKDAVIYKIQEGIQRLQMVGSLWKQTDILDSVTPIPPRVSFEIANETIQSNQVNILREDNETKLVVPLVRGKNIQKILLVIFPAQHQFSKRDLEAVDLLANQATGHLENAILYEQIQSTSNRMSTILNSTHDGIILLDRKNRIMDFNHAAEELLGLDLLPYRNVYFDELPITYELLDDSKTPLEMRGRQEKISTAGEIIRTEYQQKRDDGGILYIEQTRLPVHDIQDRVNGNLLVLRDITEERELALYRDEIIFMLVHDLRSPLGSVIAGLRFAQDLLEDGDDMNYLTEVLELSYSSSNRLMTLINTLLDVERDQMSMLLDNWPVEILIDNAYNELINRAKEVKITIDVKLDDNLPYVQVDGEKIQRVLINLIDNALDYAESQISISAMHTESNWITIRVADDGIGIPMEKRVTVFGKFSQGNGQDRRHGKHTGIGLTFCRRAIEAHGGTINVTDGCDLPGACFEFTLPISPEITSPNLHSQSG